MEKTRRKPRGINRSTCLPLGADVGNKLLTLKEISKELLTRLESLSIAKQRAFFYDWQTSVGGFPASKRERSHYIKTGQPFKTPLTPSSE